MTALWESTLGLSFLCGIFLTALSAELRYFRSLTCQQKNFASQRAAIYNDQTAQTHDPCYQGPILSPLETNKKESGSSSLLACCCLLSFISIAVTILLYAKQVRQESLQFAIADREVGLAALRTQSTIIDISRLNQLIKTTRATAMAATLLNPKAIEISRATTRALKLAVNLKQSAWKLQIAASSIHSITHKGPFLLSKWPTELPFREPTPAEDLYGAKPLTETQEARLCFSIRKLPQYSLLARSLLLYESGKTRWKAMWARDC